VVGLVLGLGLAWSGLAKLRRPDGGSALIELLHDAGRVRAALRLLGAVELVLAVGLLAGAPAAGPAAAVLGVGFVGYLAWARHAAPDRSCGCSAASYAPVSRRSFARAGLVVAGGLLAGAGPVTAAAGLVVLALVDERWRLPARRARLRLLGHPLAGPPQDVPVAATVELLETSLAWHQAAGVVRSGLLETWDEAGWRFLRYAGVADGPVTVVFTLDATATVDTTAVPAVRLAVVPELQPA
jgi:hypothetical protein